MKMLIQRLVYSPSPFKKGVDQFFLMDYMGRAEFEFNTKSEALKRMRADLRSYSETPIRIKLPDGNITWFVGPKDCVDTAKDFFEHHLKNEVSPNVLEPTYLKVAYQRKPTENDPHQVIGWWALEERPWAIFMKKSQAKDWLTGVWGGNP